MLTELTPEQERLFAQHRVSWLEAWRSTQPVSRAEVEAAVTVLYGSVRLAQPEFVWVASPAAAVAWSAENVGKLRVAVWDAVRSPSATQVEGIVLNLSERLRRRLAFVAGSAVTLAADDMLRDRYGINFWYRQSGNVWFTWGDAGVPTVAVREFAESLGCTTATPTSRARAIVDRSVWYWWPFKDVCIVSERPEGVLLDDRERLHSLSGPVVRFRDGWSAYAVRGTTVPRAWIEDRASLAPETALTWPNVEQRRVAAELVGWERVLDGLDAVTVDAHPNPQIGTLLRADLPDMPGALFLRVRCGTGRTFVLPVPREMTTALQANAWTYNVTEEQLLKLEVRT